MPHLSGLLVFLLMLGCSLQDRKQLSVDGVNRNPSTEEVGNLEVIPSSQPPGILEQRVVASRVINTPDIETAAKQITQLECPRGTTIVALTAPESGETEEVIRWNIGDSQVAKLPRLTAESSGFVTHSILWSKRDRVIRVSRTEGTDWRVLSQNIDTGAFEFLPGDFADWVPAITIGAAGRSPLVMAATFDKYWIWHVTPEPRLAVRIKPHGVGVIAVDPTGKEFATPLPLLCNICSTSTGESTCVLSGGTVFDIKTISYSGTGKYIGIGGERESRGERISVWESATRTNVLDSGGPGTRTQWLAFSNSEELLATANPQSTISIWQLREPKEVRHFTTGFTITGGIAFSESDEMLVVGTDNGLKVFRVEKLLSQP